MVQQLKNKEEWEAFHAGAGDKVVIVDFTASWCGPCKHIAPEFEKLASDNPSILFVKVDVDENDAVAQECGISAMPTFQVFKNGKKLEEFRGADAGKLKAVVEKYK